MRRRVLAFASFGKDGFNFIIVALLAKKVRQVRRNGVDNQIILPFFVRRHELIIIGERFETTLAQALSQSGLLQFPFAFVEMMPHAINEMLFFSKSLSANQSSTNFPRGNRCFPPFLQRNLIPYRPVSLIAWTIWS